MGAKAKQSYQFTLILKNVNEHTPGLEDSLYEAGCDDALINFRNAAVFLEFDRASISFENAVISAIKQVESSSVEAKVANLAPEDLVTLAEAAKRLNKTRQIVFLWMKEARRKSTELPFPSPKMKLSDKSPLWKWREIVEWLYFHHLISNKEMVDRAIFVEHLNAVLEERDYQVRQSRQMLLEKLSK
jgi:hypothetical protein